jgi:hypothetical protein
MAEIVFPSTLYNRYTRTDLSSRINLYNVVMVNNILSSFLTLEIDICWCLKHHYVIEPSYLGL